MHILKKSQDPEADGGLNNSSALVDPEAPPSTVGCDRNKNEPTFEFFKKDTLVIISRQDSDL